MASAEWCAIDLRDDLSAGRFFKQEENVRSCGGDRIRNCGSKYKNREQHGNSENSHAECEQAGIRIGLMCSPVSAHYVHTVVSGKQNDHDTENGQDQNSSRTMSGD